MNNLEKKISERFPNENLSVLSYQTMKEPAIVKCNNCNTVYELQKAENFIRNSKKCICRKCINNGSGKRNSLEDFQKQINKKYPNEQLEVINYTLRNEKCSIKCLKCNSIFTLDNAGSFMNKDKKRICKTCIPNKVDMLNNLKDKFLSYIKNENIELLSNIHSNEVKSDTIIYSKCKICGDISGRTMNDYLRGRKCPKCQGNKIYSNKEYQEMLGEEYTLLSDYRGMEHQVKIKHNLCGFCYNKNARHYTCPKCSGSKGEKAIAFLLEKYKINYEKEKEEIINNHKLRFDFYIKEYDVYIEFQGEQHTKAIGYFGGEKALIKQQEYDNYKREWIKQNNKILLEINYDENIEEKLFIFLLKFNDHLERE